MGTNAKKLAVFECDRLQDLVGNGDGGSNAGAGYVQLLQKVADHVRAHASKISLGQINAPPALTFTGFDVQGGKYPEDIAKFDGVLIIGSLSGVYEEEAWIERLLNEIRDLDKKKVRTVGIGFGHQAIAQALGGQVARNPKGPEVSVRKAQVTKDGKDVFLPVKDDFSLHYHHHDAIVKLPSDFLVLASSSVTEFQSIYKRQQFLTFCGHPEFSHNVEVLAKLMQYDQEKCLVPHQLLEHALPTLSQPSDYEWVVMQIFLFFLKHFDNSPRTL
ncbi:hypothetical protein KC19_10G147500 [Ceratodon purpureus]|uniref:Glutamine amidotransferase domain-containing protein n=1 Tax=Ceratodon purpureus TaxID=3225 RepID=A0A8T0GNE0_CERPU|nr:hypothetical protein KC19_10G147500 [Ceratodon purpureus]